MGKPKIVLAIPTGRPLKAGKLPRRVMRFAQEFNQLMPAWEVVVSHSACPREAHAMNSLIEQFRNDPGAQWLVWWDIAVEIEPDELRQLFHPGKGVVGALCTAGYDDDQWDAKFYPDILPDEYGLVPVPELGGRVKVFHRSVFDVIEKDTPDLAYIFDSSGRSLTAFCQENIGVFGEYQRLLSASQSLDLLCRKAKIGIFAHAGVVLKWRDIHNVLHPRLELFRPWLFKREPPPVCVEDLAEGERDARPIAVAVQYCDKDKDQAERVFEQVEKWGADRAFLVYSPGDKYPKGPNDLVLSLIRNPSVDCKAVLLIEPDCCPLTPDWLDQLSRDWDKAATAGYLVMGSWHPVNADHPTLGHLNGNLMFSPDLAKRVSIPDVPDDKPWDTYLAATFAPHWCRTGLIKNLNRHKTATTRQLTEPECGTRPPVLIHGVKDDSAWKHAENLCATKSSSVPTGQISSG